MVTYQGAISGQLQRLRTERPRNGRNCKTIVLSSSFGFRIISISVGSGAIWKFISRDESFWRWKEVLIYIAQYSRRELNDATKSDGQIEVRALGRSEKTAVPGVLD